MPTVVDCPICGKKVEWTEQNKYRPFCSERCKKIDLGSWAEEKYAIPSPPALDDEDDGASQQQ